MKANRTQEEIWERFHSLIGERRNNAMERCCRKATVMGIDEGRFIELFQIIDNHINETKGNDIDVVWVMNQTDLTEAEMVFLGFLLGYFMATSYDTMVIAELY